MASILKVLSGEISQVSQRRLNDCSLFIIAKTKLKSDEALILLRWVPLHPSKRFGQSMSCARCIEGNNPRTSETDVKEDFIFFKHKLKEFLLNYFVR